MFSVFLRYTLLLCILMFIHVSKDVILPNTTNDTKQGLPNKQFIIKEKQTCIKLMFSTNSKEEAVTVKWKYEMERIRFSIHFTEASSI